MKTSTGSKIALDTLQKKINIKFSDPELLKNAFIHRSYLNEHRDFAGQSNERLEFLGDSVLSLAVSDFLFTKLLKSPEGELTQIRASLVRTETLASLAEKIFLGEYLFLSKGEEDSAGRGNKTILANTFEALIGAIYLDQGFPVANAFIKKFILDNWKTLTQKAAADNKSKLQEVLQRKHHQSPTYKLLESWGPDHDRNFEVGVYLQDALLGKGVGKNKQTAAQDAAGNALQTIDVKTTPKLE